MPKIITVMYTEHTGDEKREITKQFGQLSVCGLTGHKNTISQHPATLKNGQKILFAFTTESF